FLHRPGNGTDALFHTNAFAHAQMQAVQVSSDAVYTHRAPKALRGRRVHASAEQRSQRFRELLATTDVFGPDELATLMADHGPAGQPNEYSPCVHSPYWNTTASMQYFPKSRRMRVAFSRPCQATYEEIEL